MGENSVKKYLSGGSSGDKTRNLNIDTDDGSIMVRILRDRQHSL